MALQDYQLHISAADQIAWITSQWKKAPNLYVKIRVEEWAQRTRVVKRNITPSWNEDFFLSANSSSTLSLLVKHHTYNPLIKDPCVGGVEIQLNKLRSLCENNQHATLQLNPAGSKNNHANAGFIVVQLTIHTLIQAGKTATTNARQDIISNDNFLRSLDTVVMKLDVFVRIVDKGSKIHPYVNFAWQVISSLYKAVNEQVKRDKKLVDLVMAMENVYSFVDTIHALPSKLQVLEDTITKILKQTIECAMFIREYTGHGFGSRVAIQAFSDASHKIDDFSNKLIDLKQIFDSGVTMQAAFVSTRTMVVAETLVKAVKHQAEKDNLKDLNPAPMDSFSRSECLPNTRQVILKFVMDWLTTPSGSENVLWLHAMAGFGKSTISTTVAESFRELGRLGAFIFFNRNTTDSDPAVVIRTLSYQLARFDQSIKSAVCDVIEDNPGITESAIRVQFSELILRPLTSFTAAHSQGPIIIILDALDECGDQMSRRSLLALLAQELIKLPAVFRFVITSRREADIDAAFRGRPNIVAIDLHFMDESKTQDIALYIRHHIAALPHDDLACDWPGEARIQKLITSSEGLFIWASTAMKFIESGYDPEQRLNALLNSKSKRKSKSALDVLYCTALSMITTWDEDEDCEAFRMVLGAIVVGRTPLSDTTLDLLLRLDGRRSSRYILKHLRCVLYWEPGQAVRVLHASFADYLSDPDRCGGHPWFIQVSHHHRVFALACFQQMKVGLRFNICDLETSHVLNDHVPDLYIRIKDRIPDHLSYACRFWGGHLQQTEFDPGSLACLVDFLYVRLLHWLEILSLIKEMFVPSRALKSVVDWTKGHNDEVAAFAADAIQFVTVFRQAISQSTPHIYLSAMPFIPATSMVAHKYLSLFPQLLSVDTGRAFKWPILLQVLEGHTDFVNSVAFSPDGRHIVSGSKDGTIKIWDVEAGEMVLGPLVGHMAEIYSVAFSPDSKRIASGSHDQTIRVWNAKTGEALLNPMKGHTGPVTSVRFSPDGMHIISGSYDRTIRLWDAEMGTVVLAPLCGHKDGILSVTFSSNGKHIASGSKDRNILVWNSETGKEVFKPLVGHTDEVWSVTFSPDSHYIASASADETIRVWSAETGTLVLGPLKGHTDAVYSIAYSSDGKRFVSGSEDLTVRLWNAQTGEPISAPFEGHKDAVTSVMFSPNGKYIASGSNDNNISLWNAEIDQVTSSSLEGHTNWIRTIAISPDSNIIISGSDDKTIRMWNIATGCLMPCQIDSHRDWVTSVAFSPDGRWIVSGSKDQTIQISCAHTGSALLAPLRGHTDTVRCVAFSPDGTLIVSGSDDQTIRVWSAETGQNMLASLKGHMHAVMSVVFSSDGQLIVSGSKDATVRVWNAITGRQVLKSLEGHTSWVFSVAISHDCNWIASGSDDQTIRVWDVKTGDMLWGPFKGHEGPINSIAFSQSCEHIFSASDDCTIRVWSTQSGEQIVRPLQGHTSLALSLALSSNGRWIASSSADQTVRVWDTLTCDVISEIHSSCSSAMDDTVSCANDVNQFGHTQNQAASADFFNDSKLADGWMLGRNSELLFWVPPLNRVGLWRPGNSAVLSREVTKLNLQKFVHGSSWTHCRPI